MGSEQLHLKHYIDPSDGDGRLAFETFMEDWVSFYRDQWVEMGLDFMEARSNDDDDNEISTFYVLTRDRSRLALSLRIKHEPDADAVNVECERYDAGGHKFRSVIDHGYNHEISEILGDPANCFHSDVRNFMAKMAEYL
jgi:hypothetical protein